MQIYAEELQLQLLQWDEASPSSTPTAPRASKHKFAGELLLQRTDDEEGLQYRRFAENESNVQSNEPLHGGGELLQSGALQRRGEERQDSEVQGKANAEELQQDNQVCMSENSGGQPTADTWQVRAQRRTRRDS